VLAAAVVLAALGALGAWYAGQGSLERTSLRDIPLTFSLEEVTAVQGTNGTRSWKLVADKSDYFKDKDVLTLQNPRFTYYTRRKRSEVRVTAEGGRFDTSAGQGRFGPDVRAEYQDIVLLAQTMQYSEEGRTFLFRDRVRVRRPDMRIRSDMAKVDLQKETVTCRGHVEVHVHGQLPM
jgi:lipopolysaccharide export system protein LptC